MNFIFVGLVFLCFNLGFGSVDFLPGFAGYVFILVGMKRYPDVLAYKAAAPAALLGAILGGVVWLTEIGLFSFRPNFPAAFVALCFQLFVTWQLSQGMWELEIQRKADLCAAALRKWWTVMAAGLALTAVVSALGWNLPAVVPVVVGVIGTVLYLVAFYQSKRLLARAESGGEGRG